MRERGGGLLFFLSITALVLIFLVLNHFNTSFVDFIKFLLGLLIIVYIPGQVLYWLIRLKTRRVEMAALSLTIGMVSSTIVYKFSMILNFEVLFFLWLIFTASIFVFFLIKNPPQKKDFTFRITPTGTSFLIIILLVFSVLIMDNYRNGLRKEDGSVAIHMHYYDGFRQNAVIRELSHSVPPQMPFAAGTPLAYHYGMDLFISIFYRYLKIDVLDLNHRLIITFFFILLPLMAFSFIKDLTNSGKSALLGTFLILFGSGGFAYAATYFLGIPQWGNIFYSFYFFNITSVNSFLPAMPILFAGFFSLNKYLKARELPWLFITCFLFATSIEYKMFFIGPIIGALFFAGVVIYISRRDSSLLRIWILTSVLSLPLLITAYIHSQGGPKFVFQLKLVKWISFVLRDLKLSSLLSSWDGLVHHFQFDFSNIVLFLPAVFIFFLGSFGLSFFSLLSIFRNFFSWKKCDQTRFFLISLFLSCILYFFSIRLYFGPRPRSYTNIYVFFLAIVIINIFWSEVIVKIVSKKKLFWKILILSLVIILSIPNTARFLWTKVHFPSPRVFPETFIQAAEWFNRNTAIDSIILQPLNLRYLCYFADRRVVLDDSAHSYLTWHLTTAQIRERRSDIVRFLGDPMISGDVLKEYNISYVFVRSETNFMENLKCLSSQMVCYSDLGTKKIIKYQKTHWLDVVFKNKDYLTLQVHEFPETKREIVILEDRDGRRLFKKFDSISRN